MSIFAEYLPESIDLLTQARQCISNLQAEE